MDQLWTDTHIQSSSWSPLIATKLKSSPKHKFRSIAMLLYQILENKEYHRQMRIVLSHTIQLSGATVSPI